MHLILLSIKISRWPIKQYYRQELSSEVHNLDTTIDVAVKTLDQSKEHLTDQ